MSRRSQGRLAPAPRIGGRQSTRAVWQRRATNSKARTAAPNSLRHGRKAA